MEIFKTFFDGSSFWNNIKDLFQNFWLNDLIDVLLVSVILYYAFRLIRDTRGIQLLKGFAVFASVYLFVQIFNLKTMKVILDGVLAVGFTALVVVFQPELRRALEQMGQVKIPFLGFSNISQDRAKVLSTIDKLCDASSALSKTKTGALIVIERKTKLGDIANTGTELDAMLSTELIGNLFFVNSPLHDGAAILRGDRLLAAGCFLPISSNMSINKELGARHRAALGMSENSDALILVVSEETGAITIAEKGVLKRKLDYDTLHSLLEQGMLPEEENDKKKNGFWRKKSVEKE